MRIGVGLLALVLLAGCGNSAITKELVMSDSISIQFANTTTNSMSTDKDAIQKLAGFIGGKEKELPLECEIKPSGMIFFYSNGQTKHEVTFTDLSQKCRYFITRLNDKVVYTEVSNEAADFLTAIREGKSRY